jgi:hypothetical protein
LGRGRTTGEEGEDMIDFGKIYLLERKIFPKISDGYEMF